MSGGTRGSHSRNLRHPRLIPGRAVPIHDEPSTPRTDGASTSGTVGGSPFTTPLVSPVQDTPESSVGTTVLESTTTSIVRDNRVELEVCGGQFVKRGPTGEQPSAWFGKEVKRRRNWQEFWPTLRIVPIAERKLWWAQFKRTYKWPGHTDEDAYAAFTIMEKRRYKNIIHSEKQSWLAGGLQPEYIKDDVWDKFVAHWQSEETKEVRVRAQAARASPGTGLKPNMGTRNFMSHHRALEAIYGEGNVRYGETWQTCHGKPQEDGTHIWNTPQCESVFTQYRQNLERATQFAPDPTQIDDRLLLAEALGPLSGRPRGDRIVGIGPSGRQILGISSRARPSSSFQTTGRDPSRTAALEETVEHLRQHTASLEQRLEQQNQLLQQLLQQRYQPPIGVMSIVPKRPRSRLKTKMVDNV